MTRHFCQKFDTRLRTGFNPNCKLSREVSCHAQHRGRREDYHPKSSQCSLTPSVGHNFATVQSRSLLCLSLFRAQTDVSSQPPQSYPGEPLNQFSLSLMVTGTLPISLTSQSLAPFARVSCESAHQYQHVPGFYACQVLIKDLRALISFYSYFDLSISQSPDHSGRIPKSRLLVNEVVRRTWI